MESRSQLSTLVIFLLLLLLSVPSLSFKASDVESVSLSVPSNVFNAAVQLASKEIRAALALVGKFHGVFDDFRESTAIADCVSLLDFSSDELAWTIDAIENPKKRSNGMGTGNPSSDLRTWLSAALGNQDTCLDGFERTNGITKRLIAGSLSKVNSLVLKILTMVKHVPRVGKISRRLLKGGFPDWMPVGERRMLRSPADALKVDLTVAQDGTGDFSTVMEAVNAAPERKGERFVIYVKKGVYKENVEITKRKWNIMMVGEGMGVTIISGNRSFVDGWTTFRSATFIVVGQAFIARDMTIENTAGPIKHQAVALRSDSDLSVFYRCDIRGYQDTLYAHSLRQFYRECRISGTVDFIFGNGVVVFQNCQIIARKPLPNQKNSITAQGRKEESQNTGFSIQFCNISADPELINSKNSTATYLGRPWKEYSRIMIMQSYLSGIITPEGWLEWDGKFALNSLYYGEYMNYGPGAALGNRVKWPGYHQITDSGVANNFTVVQFIDGGSWLPATGVKFTAGLTI